MKNIFIKVTVLFSMVCVLVVLPAMDAFSRAGGGGGGHSSGGGFHSGGSGGSGSPVVGFIIFIIIELVKMHIII